MLAYQIHMSKHHLALSVAMQCSSVPSNKLHQLSKDVVLVCHQIDCSQCQMIVPPIWCYCVEGQEVFETGSPLRSLFIQVSRGNCEFPIRYLNVAFKWQLVFSRLVFEHMRLRNKSTWTYLLSLFYRNIKIEYFIYFYMRSNYTSYE